LAINYDPHSSARLRSGQIEGVEVVDVPNTSTTNTGFGENHNTLFHAHPPVDSFVIINPDCIPQEGSIDALFSRKASSESEGKVAIVEGRQWPFEHPKEYDPVSLKTPWASGAFLLIDSDFYKRVGGMDEIYFLYLEDVDLSWQAWLNGYSVLYEPAAATIHFSSGKFYRDDLVYYENYLNLRNFLILSKKFFGQKGEAAAVAMLKVFPDRELADHAIQEYFSFYQKRVTHAYQGKDHSMVRILGLNQFHKMRIV
jgi:GT2 family glycosyltransferase